MRDDAEAAPPREAAEGGGALNGAREEGLDGEERDGSEARLGPPDEDPEAVGVGGWGWF